MNKLTKTESLSKISKALLLAEPYYGFFLLMLNKYWDNRIPTACVGKNGINYQLRINEEFWTSLDDAKKMGLLKHELLHIAFNHLTMHFNFSDKRLANVAMDMEINQYIDANMLPEGGITLESYPELNLNERAGCRYYYDALRKAQKDKDEKGTSGSPGMDKLLDGLGNGNDPTNHDWEIFDDLSEAERKLVDKQTQRVLNQAKEQTVKRQGTVPGEIESQIILDVIVPPKFDWKGFIRRFTGISTRVFTKKIRRKENRRFSDNPGLKIKMKQHMLLAIDTSGSVSDDELKEFMNEIHHIYKTGIDITIVQCDTEIRSIAPYKGKFELGILGRGGTYFDPVLQYFNENLKNFTSLVYFTDGEAHASIKPRGNVLWVISERSSLNTSLPGKVIKLEL